GAERSADRIVPLTLHGEEGCIGARGPSALPDHDEVARGVARDRRVALIVRRVGVDLELRSAWRPARVVALALHGEKGRVAARAPEALPDHDEVARGVARDRR